MKRLLGYYTYFFFSKFLTICPYREVFVEQIDLESMKRPNTHSFKIQTWF